MSNISGDPENPRRHFRLREPARMGPKEAESLYDIVRQALATGYARSGLGEARQYLDWKRYNIGPYLSSTHGNHYLSNYANAIAKDYGRYEKSGPLPQGSVIAKDSFAVTKAGSLVLGPLFVMQKMAPGFSPASGDWRYRLIRPDGSLLGETNGINSQSVDYCIGCHLAREQFDHLFFVPQQLRVSD
jgi:hypothetical protein